jgi:hypothetical protein
MWKHTESAEFAAKNIANGKTSLARYAQVWPTPRASDVTGGIVKNAKLENGHWFRENKQGVKWGINLKDAVSGKLNPTWVSVLMGFPPNWAVIQNEEERQTTPEVVRLLQNAVGTQEIQRSSGGLRSVQTAEILRAKLYVEGVCQRCAVTLGDAASACKQDALESLRSVWGNDEVSRSPHRYERAEQFAREHPDVVQQLSQYCPPPCASCWRNGSWEEGMSRLAFGKKSREENYVWREQIKALGNAVVPQCARVIGEQIKKSWGV